VRVLLIDDDARLFELLSSYLGPNGVTLEHAPDGPSGLARLAQASYDVVLLDVMMPGPSGLETLGRLRARHAVPVLMLTARGDEADRVTGLELGADDYVAKPFSPRELLARLRALVRRRALDVAPEAPVSVAGLVVDVIARTAILDGRALELTALELDLLAALARRRGRVVSRDALLEAAGRGDVHVAERTVDVHVARLRAKLGARGPELIKTVRGHGYVFGGSDEG
jgi:DNA-binding response OmpR family regulator